MRLPQPAVITDPHRLRAAIDRWSAGMNTADIAAELRIDEAAVANSLARIREYARKDAA